MYYYMMSKDRHRLRRAMEHFGCTSIATGSHHSGWGPDGYYVYHALVAGPEGLPSMYDDTHLADQIFGREADSEVSIQPLGLHQAAREWIKLHSWRRQYGEIDALPEDLRAEVLACLDAAKTPRHVQVRELPYDAGLGSVGSLWGWWFTPRAKALYTALGVDATQDRDHALYESSDGRWMVVGPVAWEDTPQGRRLYRRVAVECQ